MIELDVKLDDGRVLHAYDTGGGGLPVFWHHGTPNIGAPPRPLFADGIRWLSYDRPGYGGSTPRPGRSVGSAAADVAAVVDALGVERFAVVGHSGGGPHALACAALLPGRVLKVVSVAGLAPFGADGLDWFGGMAKDGVAALQAATRGREVKEKYETSGVAYDPEFTPGDYAALEGEWAWFGEVVNPAVQAGPGGAIDDDIAYVTPWEFDPARVEVPVLLVHGDADRVVPSAHGGWLAARCPDAELRVIEGAGHISVLAEGRKALEWLSG